MLISIPMHVQAGRNREFGNYDSQDCMTPHGLRQVLCNREDTATMCRFFDAQTEGAAFELPSLGSGVTIFILVDAAVSRVKYMSRSSALGAPPSTFLSFIVPWCTPWLQQCP